MKDKVETLKNELKKIYGLFIIEKGDKFLLTSIVKNDIINDIIPPIEILRIYALNDGKEQRVSEFKDMCMTEDLSELNQTLSTYSQKYKKIKINFSDDNCETIKEFFVDRITQDI